MLFSVVGSCSMNAIHIYISSIEQIWLIMGQMAPYLLFGFFIAGVLSVVISTDFVKRHLGKNGFKQVAKAALLGVPIPLCSCGVIPVAASLRKQGAGKGATVSFLASTPQTGVDSIMATYALLGPVIMLFRVVTAFVSGILSGIVTEWVDKDDVGVTESPSCSRCHVAESGAHSKIGTALKYGFVTLPADIGKAVLIGIVVSGLLGAMVPPAFFADKLNGGFVSMLVMMVIGIPIYVCSTGSIPLGFAMLKMGISPGAVLVFLITGPATNAAAFATIWKLLGRRTAIVYVATIALCALMAGLVLDAFVLNSIFENVGHLHEVKAGWINHVSAIVLFLVLGHAIWQQRKNPNR